MRTISSLPNFRGKGRIFNVFKNVYLTMSDDAIFQVQGNSGTFLIDIRSFEYEYMVNKSYDEDELGQLMTYLDVDRNFIDVGANIGFYSIAIAQKIKRDGGRGKVFAFEPHPQNFDRLMKNVKLNSLEPYIRVFNVALSDKETKLNLVEREDFQAGSLTGNASIMIGENHDQNFESIEIVTERLDNFLDTISDAGLVKVDIEGHEDFFLRGAQCLIHSMRPTILLEVNLPYYKSRGLDNIHEIISDLLPGYTFKNSQIISDNISDLQDKDIINVFCVPRI